MACPSRVLGTTPLVGFRHDEHAGDVAQGPIGSALPEVQKLVEDDVLGSRDVLVSSRHERMIVSRVDRRTGDSTGLL